MAKPDQWNLDLEYFKLKIFRPSTTTKLTTLTIFFHIRVVTISKLTIFFHLWVVTTSKLTIFFILQWYNLGSPLSVVSDVLVGYSKLGS